MAELEDLKAMACEAIDGYSTRIIGLGERIMDEPELGFKEERTAQKVQQEFAQLGLAYQDKLAITGVKAVLKGKKPGPTLALMGELDALLLPEHPRADKLTGAAHACGHNAQIAGMMEAAMGLSHKDIAAELSGQVVFFAVPAEEYVEIGYRLDLVKSGKTTFLAGKPELLELGHFDDVDMAVMIHSSSPAHGAGEIGIAASSNGFLAKNIRFIGRAAHAGAAPEKGINALNAANLALNAINAQRETFRDEDCVRVHPIITKGGDLVNIIPAAVCLETYVRARSLEAVLDASEKVDRALKGAAMALGATVEIETVPGFMPLRNDIGLAKIFKGTAGSLFGPGAYRDYPHGGGSTDTGDLSQIMPVLHPVMTGGSGPIHSTDWHIADPQAGYLAPAKTLAMMAIELLGDDARAAKKIIAENNPPLTKETYLKQQKAVFGVERFEG